MSTLVIVDHSAIPSDVLTAERSWATKHDPDGCIYPWVGLYPLAGSTVYANVLGKGALWDVLCTERDTSGDPLVHLVLSRGTAETMVHRSELRPVTWTPEDEIALVTTAMTVDL